MEAILPVPETLLFRQSQTLDSRTPQDGCPDVLETCVCGTRHAFSCWPGPSGSIGVTVKSSTALVGRRTREEGIVACLTCFLALGSLTPSKNATLFLRPLSE